MYNITISDNIKCNTIAVPDIISGSVVTIRKAGTDKIIMNLIVDNSNLNQTSCVVISPKTATKLDITADTDRIEIFIKKIPPRRSIFA